MFTLKTRLELHQELVDILGTSHVYFQPPESVKMVYPCIVYSLSGVKPLYADDYTYLGTKQYQVIVVDKDPDTEIPAAVAEHFKMIRYDRRYTSNNLNHDVFTLYF